MEITYRPDEKEVPTSRTPGILYLTPASVAPCGGAPLVALKLDPLAVAK